MRSRFKIFVSPVDRSIDRWRRKKKNEKATFRSFFSPPRQTFFEIRFLEATEHEVLWERWQVDRSHCERGERERVAGKVSKSNRAETKKERVERKFDGVCNSFSLYYSLLSSPRRHLLFFFLNSLLCSSRQAQRSLRNCCYRSSSSSSFCLLLGHLRCRRSCRRRRRTCAANQSLPVLPRSIPPPPSSWQLSSPRVPQAPPAQE